MLATILGIIFILSPFLIGWGLYEFLQPDGFWQMLISFIVIAIFCFIEGFFAWIFGFILIGADR